MERAWTPRSLTNRDLVKELFSDATLLLRRQARLAELEARRDVARELRAARWLGAGFGVTYAATIVWLVAAALGIGVALGGAFWAGALIVGAGLLALGGAAALVGWRQRVKRPLASTRRGLDEEASWLKHHATT